jgi:hypothetical protein
MATHGTFPPLSSNSPKRREPVPAMLPGSPRRARLHLVAPPHGPVVPNDPTRTQRGLRRSITREEGCALEMVSHAVDYLNDRYLYDGPDDEILDFEAPAFEAARILAAAQQRMLGSLPLVESFGSRVRRSVLRTIGRLARSHVDVTPV